MLDKLYFLESESYVTYSLHLAMGIGHIPCIVLSALLKIKRAETHLLDHAKFGDDWFPTTNDFIDAATGVPRQDQELAFKKLKFLNLIDMKIMGMPGLRHFQINEETVYEVYEHLTIPKSYKTFRHDIHKTLKQSRGIDEYYAKILLNSSKKDQKRDKNNTRGPIKNVLTVRNKKAGKAEARGSLSDDIYNPEHADPEADEPKRKVWLKECDNVLLSNDEWLELLKRYGKVETLMAIRFLSSLKRVVSLEDLLKKKCNRDYDHIVKWAYKEAKFSAKKRR